LASRADESYIAQCNAQGFYPAMYYPHNMHFLWYTNAMEGRSAAAISAAREIAKHGDHMKLSEAERLSPLLSVVLARFGRWDEVLAQPVPPTEQHFASAMSNYTRGLALAGKGKSAEAESQLGAMRTLLDSEAAKKMDSPVLPATAILRICAHDLAGHVALAKKDHDKAVSELTEAVKLEDEMPYMEPPFCYMPMRHGLGAALLAADRAKDAEGVYRKDLKINPNNGWSLFGLSQSLRAQGKDDAAEAVQSQFEQAWIRADVKITSSRL
jgi:tetratricopeptide (TPR) repeat protein